MIDVQWSGSRLEVAPAVAEPLLLWIGASSPARFLWVSPSLVGALGHPADEWMDGGFIDRLVPPEEVSHLVEAWRTVAETGASRTVEFRAESAEGWIIPLAVELRSLDSSMDGAGGILGTVRMLPPQESRDARADVTGPGNLPGSLAPELPNAAWLVDPNLSLVWTSPPSQVPGVDGTMCTAIRLAAPRAWSSAHRQALRGGTEGFDVVVSGQAYRCQVGPVKDAQGRVVAAVGVATDISDLKEVARRLLSIQREHQEFIDNIDGIVWEADPCFRFMLVSRQAERLLGYPLQRWLKEPGFWAAHVHPDDREWAVSLCRRATEECRPHEFEYRMIAADGRTVWLRDIVSVITENGRPVRLRGVMVDVTAQHQDRVDLERTVSLLRATLDSTADGLLVVDRDGNITAFNRRFQELWRLSDETLEPRRDARVFRAMLDQLQEPEQFLARVRELYETPEEESFEVLQLRDGRTIERYSRPQRLGEAIVGRVWSFRDATLRVSAQAERERLLHEAHEAIRLRDDFLSIAAHELKTPLTPLKLHLQVLRQRARAGEPLNPALLDKALSQVGRLSGLINDLLDASRIEAGRLELERGPLSLLELIREVVADFRPVCPQHTFEVQEPDEPLVVLGDRGRLAQVLTNLLENAVKYSPTGGVVRITVHRQGAEAVISVADSGIGIPADQQQQLFSRFFRARNAPISGFGGLGLGLYICRDIVERHGGRIWVESEVGGGSTFRFSLPVARPGA